MKNGGFRGSRRPPRPRFTDEKTAYFVVRDQKGSIGAWLSNCKGLGNDAMAFAKVIKAAKYLIRTSVKKPAISWWQNDARPIETNSFYMNTNTAFIDFNIKRGRWSRPRRLNSASSLWLPILTAAPPGGKRRHFLALTKKVLFICSAHRALPFLSMFLRISCSREENALRRPNFRTAMVFQYVEIPTLCIFWHFSIDEY